MINKPVKSAVLFIGFLVISLLLSAGLVFGAIANHVVVSEIAVGVGGASNEFVELYNPTSSPITIDDTNFKLKFVDPSNVVSTKTITWTNNQIPAKGYFLFGTGTINFNLKLVSSIVIGEDVGLYS